LPDSSFWADKVASDIIKTRGTKHLIATGITPSGPIHLGNIREVLTADAVRRALDRKDADTKLIYIADTMDPLRRVYPFLPKSYEKYVGMPLYRIPCPEKCCGSYADHFLKPFLASCRELGVKLEAKKAHELYQGGMFTDVISRVLEKREEIAKIISKETGRDLPSEWVPFNVECANCERITEARIGKINIAEHTVEYTCNCGYSGTADYGKGAGKLPWRIDWPARWKVLGVTVEPFGKDHATAGGSYDTGSTIAKELLDYDAPYPIVYEWIYWKGKGAMASSTGVAISIQDMLKVIPPEGVRFLILRARPEKHIDFDPENGLLKLLEEYQELERRYFDERDRLEGYESRAYEISQVEKPSRKTHLHIPFLHIVIAAQVAQYDLERATKVLERSGYGIDASEQPKLKRYLEYAGEWLTTFAPDVFKFKVQENTPDEVNDLTVEEKKFLAGLAEQFDRIEWKADTVHNSIHEIGKEFGLSARKSFQATYISLLGRKSGPRAGWFITSLDRDFVINRFVESSTAG
jgi:lysyl-tRNA synthetase class 1